MENFLLHLLASIYKARNNGYNALLRQEIDNSTEEFLKGLDYTVDVIRDDESEWYKIAWN